MIGSLSEDVDAPLQWGARKPVFFRSLLVLRHRDYEEGCKVDIETSA